LQPPKKIKGFYILSHSFPSLISRVLLFLARYWPVGILIIRRNSNIIVSVIFTSQTVPIVIISAKASGKDIAIVEELGVNDYIVKPFSIREVVGRVSSLLKML